MSKRLSFYKHVQAMKPMMDFSGAVHGSGLEQPLVELVLMRVSQLNGCAYCLDMHSKDARAAGETEQRLYVLQAWREAPFYSERERAALAWAEAVTQLGPHGVPDEVYERALASFSEEELVKLNMVVVLINGWNRFAIPFQAEPGHYQPAKQHAA
ncbi:carboxymuconolactone decarboxylase family protein [Dyella sp. C9]|uniref:carboxymuconolactone decarboxylase family protein n=1 Tax=Dyella sp. C9 TaxID=2202154 RepID=UPI000DF00DB3|nr:carboxymuconolactone decarboxylase family protein [Dyella sp. C9]